MCKYTLEILSNTFENKHDKMLKKIRWSPTEKADSLAVKNMNIQADHCLYQ